VGRQREILCIDDEPEGLKVRSILLESMGYKVLSAPDAERGLQVFREHHVDAVVMDYEMPGMNGVEAAEKMKALRPETPIVILSALSWLPQTSAAIDAFVQKGGPIALLTDTIEQWLPHDKDSAAASVGGAIGHLLGTLAQALRKKAAAH
jgi:two-component system autoinducer 1 sensor kinase/phosphatase LuxN